MNTKRAAVLLSLLVPTAAQAASSPEPERIAGVYRYSGGERDIKALEGAIEDVVSKMNFFIRGIARRRLRTPNLPTEELSIVNDRGAITIAHPGRPTISAPATGDVIPWTSPDGEKFRVSHRIVDGVLVQRFEGSRSVSENRFALAEDGLTLLVFTEIRASRLPDVVKFRMSYRKVPER